MSRYTVSNLTLDQVIKAKWPEAGYQFSNNDEFKGFCHLMNSLNTTDRYIYINKGGKRSKTCRCTRCKVTCEVNAFNNVITSPICNCPPLQFASIQELVNGKTSEGKEMDKKIAQQTLARHVIVTLRILVFDIVGNAPKNWAGKAEKRGNTKTPLFFRLSNGNYFQLVLRKVPGSGLGITLSDIPSNQEEAESVSFGEIKHIGEPNATGKDNDNGDNGDPP